ncbi:MAG TPA: sialidase family protein [Candidatus Koribacter sp.]|jgi:hypothetical protein
MKTKKAWILPSFAALLWVLGICCFCTIGFAQIAVGPTTIISADAPTDPHGESFFAVNPKNSNDQIAASCRISDKGPGVSGYVTHDGGKTWARIPLPKDVDEGWDVITYFDGEGNAYFASNDHYGLWIVRSADAGHTWGPAMLLPGIEGFDRQHMAFDRSGRFAGRIYAGATGDSMNMDGKQHGIQAISFSTDGGKTYVHPHLIGDSQKERMFAMSNILVEPDGTVVVPFFTFDNSAADDASLFDSKDLDKEVEFTRHLRVAVSGDGGETYSVGPSIFTTSIKAAFDAGFKVDKIQGNGFATVDYSNGPYRGRAYVVWVEASGDHHDIRVIHSSDSGKTWSKPATVNDNVGPVDDANPTIAVNNRGVVGVSWNDRRSHKDDCFELYFSASLDGGETFLPNVASGRRPTCPLAPGNWKPSAKISPYPKTEDGESVEGQGLNVLMISTRFPGGGDTQGLGADDSGVFHAAWIDGSSGVMQLAGTPFTVSGDVHEPERASKDVSTQVKLVANDCGFDWKANTFSCRMHLENKSPLAVQGPFRVELQTSRVNLTDWRVENAANQKPSDGARWKFATVELAPKASSEEQVFRWHFSGRPKEPEYPFMMFKVESEQTKAPRATGAASK